jgi:pimeloyl-ACP methyl ester carboxylesterase
MVGRRCRIGDRSVGYGEVAAGGGPARGTVLLLHGWALGQRSYRAVAEAMGGRGYRVLVPDLPGFGSSGDLPPGRVSFRAYASFLSELLDALEPEARVHVVGHSFGGGVAVQFAHDFGRRVRSVVLLDAVSGATWTRGDRGERLLAERPLWDWGIHLVAELPLGRFPAAAGEVVADLVTNLVRHPGSLGLVAHLIVSSDLRVELSELRERGVPVAVVWASGDRVVPRAAYEDQCGAVGHEGVVVSGNHGWLLNDPGMFARVVVPLLEAADGSPSAA